MKNTLRSLLATAALALTVGFLATGCKTHIALGGAYAPAEFQVSTNTDGSTTTTPVITASPDLAFYAADTAYNLAYATVDGALMWERENRTTLFVIDPEIKHRLDKVRPIAWDIHRRWALARKAYLANPVPANLSSFQNILAEAQRLLPTIAAAQALVTKQP